MRSILTIAVIGGFITLSGAAFACGSHGTSAAVVAPRTAADAVKAPMTKTPTYTTTKTTKPSG